LFEGPLAIGASRALARAANLRLPDPMLRAFIKAYTVYFGADMSVVVTPLDGFGCFGDFFARRLRTEARPVCRDPGAVVSPCDAVVQERSRIDADATNLITIKGDSYSMPALIGDADVAAGLAGGGFCVLYLHPRDYHRVHVPTDGTLTGVRHMPGTRYPMAPWASGLTDRALGKNERVAFDIELPRDGLRCVLLMVAAFGVGGIESPYLPDGVGGRRTGMAEVVCRGDEIGAFRIGSTVVLLWPKKAFELDACISAGGRVLVGQTMGHLHCTSSRKS
jgi:phosphatidylserine decarboxylase